MSVSGFLVSSAGYATAEMRVCGRVDQQSPGEEESAGCDGRELEGSRLQRDGRKVPEGIDGAFASLQMKVVSSRSWRLI
jgi:hypothetical protein